MRGVGPPSVDHTPSGTPTRRRRGFRLGRTLRVSFCLARGRFGRAMNKPETADERRKPRIRSPYVDGRRARRRRARRHGERSRAAAGRRTARCGWAARTVRPIRRCRRCSNSSRASIGSKPTFTIARSRARCPTDLNGAFYRVGPDAQYPMAPRQHSVRRRRARQHVPHQGRPRELPQPLRAQRALSRAGESRPHPVPDVSQSGAWTIRASRA